VSYCAAPLLHKKHLRRLAALHGDEDADDALAAANFLIELFHPLGGSQPSAIGFGQCEDGGGIVEAGIQDGQYLPW
jgi:hypothetical protein